MRVLISHDEIVKMCEDIGQRITLDYVDKTPVVVCVLKGACPFHSELIKHIDLDMEVDYIQVSSYVGTESTGKVAIKKDFDIDITGRDVIVVEDIVDTGITLDYLDKIISSRGVNSVSYVTMLDKPSRRQVDIRPDYVGKTIDNLFVIGFGLDLDEKYRNLADVYVYNED